MRDLCEVFWESKSSGDSRKSFRKNKSSGEVREILGSFVGEEKFWRKVLGSSRKFVGRRNVLAKVLRSSRKIGGRVNTLEKFEGSRRSFRRISSEKEGIPKFLARFARDLKEDSE